MIAGMHIWHLGRAALHCSERRLKAPQCGVNIRVWGAAGRGGLPARLECTPAPERRRLPPKIVANAISPITCCLLIVRWPSPREMDI